MRVPVSLDQYVINITERNWQMWGLSPEEVDRVYGPTWIERQQQRNQQFREHCMSGEVMAKPMTLMELHTAVRSLVPKNFTTFVDLSVKTYSHRPDEMDVVVSAWVHSGRCDVPGHAVDGDTCEQVLEKVKAVVLPELGLVDVPPVEERLAAMGRGETEWNIMKTR